MGSLGLGFGAAHLHFEGMPLPRPVLSSSPTVTGSGVETTPLLSDETDTWSHGGSPATVTAREYRLVLGGSVVVEPQSAASITIPAGTGGQSYSYELRVTVSEGGGAQSAWTPLATGTVSDALNLSQTADGEVQINHASGTVTVTITSPSWYANYDAGNGPGVFTFDSALLDTGPVNLVPPLIERTTDADSSGTVGIGDPASDISYPGLWVYDPDVGGIGKAAYQWQADAGGDDNFANLSGATSSAYTLTSNEAGDDVRVQETLADNGGSRTVSSAAVSIESVPSVVFTDGFNRPNEELTTSTDWAYAYRTNTTIVANIVSNQLRFSQGQSWSVVGVTYEGSIGDDQYAEVEYVSMDDGAVGPIVRMFGDVDGIDGYWAKTEAATITLTRRDAGGTETPLGTGYPHTLTSGDVIRIEASGSTITVYLNDVQIIEGTDSTYASGKPGIRCYLDGTVANKTVVDNFKAGDV